MGNIIFNGKSLQDLDVFIQTPPTYVYPERDVEMYHIPGRNGDLVIDNHCFKNVQRSYDLAISYKQGSTYMQNATSINNWLHSAGADYAELEDTYDPDVVRLAKYSESNSFKDIYEQALIITATFECKPQRFLKEGRLPQIFNSNTAQVENPSVYEALPLIKIEGISTDISKILLMSVINSSNDVVSTLSIKTEDSEIFIDSEKQNCYTDTEDINYKIGLNGKPFPYFGEGENTISIQKYDQNSIRIDQYTKVISDNQIVCKSEYKPQDTLIAEQEDKIYIKPYDSIIVSNQKSYQGQAYQSYMTSVAEKGLYDNNSVLADSFTFTSFNKILESVAMQFSVLGNVSDNPTLVGEGNGYIRIEQSGDKLDVYSTVAGYFLTSLDKIIKFVSSNTKIATVPNYSSLTVNYYPTDLVHNTIQVSYDDMPSWLSFEIEYISDGGVKSPYKIKYKTNHNGTYWTDKSWTFGKAKWTYLDANSVLAELAWSNIKKAFMPTVGISISTTTSYTFRYIGTTIQYPSTEDEPSYIKIVRPSSIPSGTEDFNQIKLVTDRSGYYSYQLNDNASTRTNWVQKAANADLVTIKGTDSFKIFYLSSIPDYSDELDWPEWLDPNVITVPANDPLNATYVKFKVLEEGLYRYSYIIKNNDNSNEEKYTNWVQLSANSVIDFQEHPKTPEEGFYISKIDYIPEEYSNDRCYAINDGTPSENPPEWLNVIYSEVSDENPDGKIEYTASANGYYKWDTNSVWLKKQTGDSLLSSGLKDDTVIYYMNNLPNYPEYSIVNVTATEDTTGNPNDVIITAKISGYYRVNYDSDWTYYNIGDVIYEATVGEEIRISYLTLSDNQDDNITITIIPRWWIL